MSLVVHCICFLGVSCGFIGYKRSEQNHVEVVLSLLVWKYDNSTSEYSNPVKVFNIRGEEDDVLHTYIYTHTYTLGRLRNDALDKERQARATKYNSPNAAAYRTEDCTNVSSFGARSMKVQHLLWTPLDCLEGVSIIKGSCKGPVHQSSIQFPLLRISHCPYRLLGPPREWISARPQP